jgi:lipopolysaccharide biosynthesis regulator YciM
MLRNEDSDPRVILESQLDDLRHADKSIVVDELVDQHFPEDYAKAVREVSELDDPDHIPEDDEEIRKLYADIEQDREEYERQRGLDEEKRGDDFEELEATMGRYSKAIEEAMERIQKPRRDNWMAMEMSELIDIVRQDRIEEAAGEAYLHTFNAWQWYVCTYKPRAIGVPNERYFSDFNVMRFETPTEVVLTLRAAFEELEQAMGRSRLLGNS